MADLNIIPEPGSLALHTAIQTGVFLSSAFVINRFFVQPYLNLRKKRIAATTGSQAMASDILEDNLQRQKQLDQKLADALNSARQSSAEIVKKAQEERVRIIQSAETESSQNVSNTKSSILSRYELEKQKLVQSVDDISQQVVQKIMG